MDFFISIVPQAHCRIIERFGKPVRVQESGLRFRIPFLEQVKNVADAWPSSNRDGVFIEKAEQILDTTPRECFTRDNAKVSADCIIRWRIVDPIKAVYEVDRLHKSLIESVLNEMRAVIGSSDLDYILGSRATLSEKIVANVAATAQRWGIQIISIEIKELRTDQVTQDAMLQQLNAERQSRAISLEARGKAEATLRDAEAEKEASILKAEGKSRALAILAEAEKSYLEALSASVGKEEAARILMAQKMLDAYAVIASKPGDKVYIPTGMNTLLSLSDQQSGK